MMFVIVMVDEFSIIIVAITNEGNKLFGLVKLLKVHPQLIIVAFNIRTVIELLIIEEELQWNIASLPLIIKSLTAVIFKLSVNV